MQSRENVPVHIVPAAALPAGTCPSTVFGTAGGFGFGPACAIMMAAPATTAIAVAVASTFSFIAFLLAWLRGIVGGPCAAGHYRPFRAIRRGDSALRCG